MLEALRCEPQLLNLRIPGNNLVAWRSGNVSVRDPGSGLVVNKPGGIRYEHLTPESKVVVPGRQRGRRSIQGEGRARR